MRKEDINLTGLDLYLFTTIDVTRKRKGSIIQYGSISTSDVLFFSFLS